MASYGVVTYGSRGDSVRELQNILNGAGYGLDVDGVFGQKTLSAVRSYQQQKGLDVDGKVGPKTWEALTGSGSVSASGAEAPQNATAEKVKEYEAARPSYQPSDGVNKAAETLADYEKNKPGEYQSSYQEQIDALLGKVLNREKFSYDVSADPVYQQYKDQYTRLGNMAMRDTVGNAAALTGGYGNSYATTAGSQAYQGYLSQLNNVVPELYSAAYDRYAAEGQRELTNLGLLQDMDQTAYGKYRDQVGDYYNDLNYYYGKYNDMSEDEYNRYLNDLSGWEADRAYYYSKLMDEQTQANWQKEYEMALQQLQAQLAGGGGGGGGSRSGGSSRSGGGSGYSIYDAVLDTAKDAQGVVNEVAKSGGKNSALSMMEDIGWRLKQATKNLKR